MDVEVMWFWAPSNLQTRWSWLPQDPDEQCPLDEAENAVRNYLPESEPRSFATGTALRLSTPDPVALPLPSATLMWWHSSIWRVIAAAGLGVEGPKNEQIALTEHSRDTSAPRSVPKRKFDEEQDKPEKPPGKDLGGKGPPGEDPDQAESSSLRKSARIMGQAEASVRAWAENCLSEAYGVQEDTDPEWRDIHETSY
ncbi:hypothetical protein ABW21_db0208754 [Orbilia brochopaga]|nr:hypothetical protein ABW21_db0208754 [Drechslerella brochopaga]